MHNLWVFWLFFSKIIFYKILFSDCCNKFGCLGPLYTCLVLNQFTWISWIFQVAIAQIFRFYLAFFMVNKLNEIQSYSPIVLQSLWSVQLQICWYWVTIITFTLPALKHLKNQLSWLTWILPFAKIKKSIL